MVVLVRMGGRRGWGRVMADFWENVWGVGLLGGFM